MKKIFSEKIIYRIAGKFGGDNVWQMVVNQKKLLRGASLHFMC